MRKAVALTLTLLAVAAPTATAQSDALHAGAASSDVTPPTGYPLLGWARGDARATGQHTRLLARAIVLERGGHKLALVAVDANSIPGGMVQHAIDRVRARGFDERNVVIAASHTHGGPTGFSNFLFKDSAFATPQAPRSGVSDPDPLLYTFMVERVALAIARADDQLAPATAGWGSARLEGVTRNRSLEAHLADHGIHEERGAGRVEQDPEGYAHTIDPAVDVLRVDRVRGSRHTPLAAWSVFANHGTVYKSTFPFYNSDHHGPADRIIEAALRRQGARDPVNVYGNGAAGDVSAGLDHSGPAGAAEVGRREAQTMLSAWRAAGRRLDGAPLLDTRWTRVCFCGQQTSAGRLDDHAVFGKPYFTGSEEGRGPLFEATGEIWEGQAAPLSVEPQGNKIPVRRDVDGTQAPNVVPLTAARVGDRLLVGVPGEMTVEMGRRTTAAAAAASAGTGVTRVVLAGYANEYASYFTTPEEYAAQHYEGGTTIYGPASGPFVAESLADLAGRLARGEPAPDAAPFDPTRGLRPDAGAYPDGAAQGEITQQPAATERLARATFAWRGGGSGTDRPLDSPFVTIERRAGRRWRTADTDLGLNILWSVEDDRPQNEGAPRFAAGDKGTYTARWEAPLPAPAGVYRFVVTARRYSVTSAPFQLRPASTLSVAVERGAGSAFVRLAYPAPVVNVDLTARPAQPGRGTVRARVGGHTVTARVVRGTARVPTPNGEQVTVPAGGARDAYGNRNGQAARG
jgi:neutral ceramidase